MFKALGGRVLVAVLLQVLTRCLPGLQQGHGGEMAPVGGVAVCLRQAEPCLCWLQSDGLGAGSSETSWRGCQGCWGRFFSHGSRGILRAAGDTDNISCKKTALLHPCWLTSFPVTTNS